jgi:hypothetical protein
LRESYSAGDIARRWTERTFNAALDCFVAALLAMTEYP